MDAEEAAAATISRRARLPLSQEQPESQALDSSTLLRNLHATRC